jgi:hypothetical protein
MPESPEIAQLREHIRTQRSRLARDEAPEPIAAEPVADAGPRSLAGRPERSSSAIDTVVEVVKEYPGVALGVGAMLMFAGPRRSLRLARGAMRGALFVLATYRGVSGVLSLLSAADARSGAARARGSNGRMRRA